MRVQAALFLEPERPFAVETLDLAPPRASEVLVDVKAAGVCRSDWHVATGDTKHPAPAVVGHEGAGVVAAIGEGVTRVRVGDHVALNWAPSCGTCFYCLADRPSLCDRWLEPVWAGTMLDGTTRFSREGGDPVYQYCSLGCFADHTVVPEASCVPLPAEVPFPVAALIGCAVTTGVGATLRTVHVAPGDSVAVIGAGGVGLSVVLGARLAGAKRILAVDVTEEKAKLATEFGATDALVHGPSIADEIRERTNGRGADWVFEAIGLPSAQELALDVARPGGTIVLAGLAPMGSSTNLPGALITRQEKTVVGSYYGTANAARDFPLYAELYLAGRLDLDRLISRTWSLDRINDAYEEMLGGGVARGVIEFP